MSSAGAAQITTALARITLFSRLSDAERAAMAADVRLRRYKKGEVLIAQGARADSVCGVVKGRVKVSLLRADGREATLALLGPGDVFGELGLFQDGTRSAQVIALEAVLVVHVGKREFLRALAETPSLGVALSELLSDRVRKLAAHFDDVTTLSVEQRLARKLVILMERWGTPTADGVGLTLELSQQDLAELAETTRQSVNKCLQAWRAVGVLADSGRGIVVRQLAGLNRIAGWDAT